MTPEERKLVEELFDKLAALEDQPRDPQAVEAINDGLQRAPNALYPLVQTVLVQDEALKRADACIRALEQELGIQPDEPARPGGFLDNMRDTLGRREPRGSVPSVRPTTAPVSDAWGAPSPREAAAERDSGSPGGSFLGTAAAAAAGVIGGALLMNSLRGLFGSAQAAPGAFQRGDDPGTPWGSSAGGDLAREAGLDDIGRGGRSAAYDEPERLGLFDAAEDDAEDFEPGDDFDADFDPGDGGDTA